ncbi:FAD-binding protein [Synechococcus sp. UW140]|uniref:FAD-binding protein n=1 Tax=Synechococcus sp. UW140 TaxID=368503 RepID=UPI000E0E6428|nr:FAD-binding protein [Synechococcus sp. UW140]
MAPVRNPLAADCLTKGTLLPSSTEVESILRSTPQPLPLRICSGGTTSRCTEDQHWTLDLSDGHRTLVLNNDHTSVRLGAGLTMGEIQAELAIHGRMIPTGLSGLPGAGFLVTGGMGPLSRSLGLAIDHIEAIRGVWGNGSRFRITRPGVALLEHRPEHMEWRGLLGAALFLGVVQELDLQTTPLRSVEILQGCVTPQELVALILEAESFPNGISLQWCWGARLEVMLVARSDDLLALQILRRQRDERKLSQPLQTCLSGIHQLPAFGAMSLARTDEAPVHQEVLGLLGPRWSDQSQALITALGVAMANRPHHRCTIACQQLGGAVSQQPFNSSSFIHRQAEWKPWITASWLPGDQSGRQASLRWLEQVRDCLHPLCPGVHLAQLHDHLPWHARELEQAFGSWLPHLRDLKQRLDPNGVLPML